MLCRLLPVFLLVAILFDSAAAGSRPWYHTAHAGKSYVNPDLTPDRMLDRDVETRWSGQLVLWQGRVVTFARHGRQTDIGLDVGRAVVPVHFRWDALNLETERRGYCVAIKGRLQIQGHRIVGLDGKSIILLHPPDANSYAVFLAANPTHNPGLESFLSWWMWFHNQRYDPRLRDTIAAAIIENAQRNGVDPLLFASLIQIESGFRIDIVSSSGAIGLGQLMPFTARGLGANPWNPEDNVRAAASMIGRLLRSWMGKDINPRALALAAYNAGPNLVRRRHAVPEIPQTTNYVYFIGYVHNDMTATATRLGVIPHEHAQNTGWKDWRQ